MAQPVKRPREEGGTFRVLVGVHLADCPPGCECDGAPHDHAYRARRDRDIRHGGKLYPADPPDYDGDTFESAADLAKRDPVKFARVARAAAAPQASAEPARRAAAGKAGGV